MGNVSQIHVEDLVSAIDDYVEAKVKALSSPQ